MGWTFRIYDYYKYGGVVCENDFAYDAYVAYSDWSIDSDGGYLGISPMASSSEGLGMDESQSTDCVDFGGDGDSALRMSWVLAVFRREWCD